MRRTQGRHSWGNASARCLTPSRLTSKDLRQADRPPCRVSGRTGRGGPLVARSFPRRERRALCGPVKADCAEARRARRSCSSRRNLRRRAAARVEGEEMPGSRCSSDSRPAARAGPAHHGDQPAKSRTLRRSAPRPLPPGCGPREGFGSVYTRRRDWHGVVRAAARRGPAAAPDAPRTAKPRCAGTTPTAAASCPTS